MHNRVRAKPLFIALHELLQNYAIAVGLAFIFFFFLPSWIRWLGVHILALVVLTTVIERFIQDWRPRPRIQSNGKAVFISGCDSGFGHMLAQRLHDLGLHVFAGCLNPESEGAQNLKHSTSSRLHIVPLDIGSEESISKAYDYVTSNLKDLKFWAVVNNAGINEGGELIWTNYELIHKVIDINALGTVRLTKQFLPLICESKGRVVAVASAAGRYTYPGLVPYCMSKQAIISFCDGLRLELYRLGVNVVTVEPWMYKTPITKETHVLNYIDKAWDMASPETKKFFSQDYLARYKKSTLRFLNWSISDKPQQVVDCLEEAVMAIQPKFSYNPGRVFSRVMFWFLEKLPKPFADLLISQHCETRAD